MRLRTTICAMAVACLVNMATNSVGATASPRAAGGAEADQPAASAKMLALLNAPDPAVRLVTFEQAPSGDRKLAISQALTSTDPTLRSAALAGFFSTNKRIVLKIDRYDVEHHHFIDKVGGAFNIYLSDFDANRYSFSTVTDFNSTRTENQVVYNLAQTGVLSGDRISFAADFERAGMAKCIVNLMLSQTMLQSHAGFAGGTMTCNNGERYTVQWVVETPDMGGKNSVAQASEAISGVVLMPLTLLGWGVQAALKPGAKEVPKLSPAERQAEITRDLAQLNSPDPAVRLATLEIAAANGDRTLRHLLLTSAFATSDPILRDAALAGAVAAADNIPLTVVGSGSNNHHLSERIGEKAYVFIRNFDQRSFAFDTITEYDRKTYNSQLKTNVDVPQSGMISGGRITFVADFEAAGSSRCIVNLMLDRVGSTAHGSMSCDNNEKYAVETDLLK